MTYVTNYLTKTDLAAASDSNLDDSVKNAVINQLIQSGVFDNSDPDDGRTIFLESDRLGGVLSTDQGSLSTPLFVGPNVAPFIQGLQVESMDVTVKTTASLKAIVDDGRDAGTHTLKLIGDAHDTFVGLGNQNTIVTLLDHGNDTVQSGSGSDTIYANDGADSLIAGAGNDLLVGGAGQDTLLGGSGLDTLIAGTGHFSQLIAGDGNTVITDLSSGGFDTLVAGSGSDTITGQQGDYFNPSMPASGGDIYNIYDGQGNSTMNSYGGDKINFFTTAGNDTINHGAGGTDTIDFSGSANSSFNNDIVSIVEGTGATKGDYTITFADNQTLQLNAHDVSHTQDAFVLKFDDAVYVIKGGS
jgi:hypothetical protein